MERHHSEPDSDSKQPSECSHAEPSTPSGPTSPSGMGMGMRMATDMVVNTLVGLGMGYYLDKWLDSSPWMTLLFFLFGAASGFRAMYRAAHAHG